MAFYRKIYRLDITLVSPLAVGSGENESTDSDVIVDSTGTPFIPASSLAGSLRSYIAGRSGRLAANVVFGFIPGSREEQKKAKNGDPEYIERNCCVRIYDGLYAGGKDEFFIATRDMVALQDKVGVKGAKFDKQAVETGAKFTAYIELLKQSATEKIKDADQTFRIDREIEAAIAALGADQIRLGSKTSRGYGSVSVECKALKFTASDDGWLDFDMTSDDAWANADELTLTPDKGCSLKLGLRLRGGVSIREYTTEPGTKEDTMPDYMQLALHLCKENGKPTPVIPGTSWAGAIRDRYSEFAENQESAIEPLFGFVHKKDVMKSVISFSESKLRGGVWKKTTRNAIDRFSGGTKDGALYTEKTYYGGETELVISFTKAPDERQIRLLSACLADLHNGFLAVGGLTSVGRGLFEIVSLNGEALKENEKTEDGVFGAVQTALEKAAGINEKKEAADNE